LVASAATTAATTASGAVKVLLRGRRLLACLPACLPTYCLPAYLLSVNQPTSKQFALPANRLSAVDGRMLLRLLLLRLLRLLLLAGRRTEG
jgi:hypothetical protein